MLVVAEVCNYLSINIINEQHVKQQKQNKTNVVIPNAIDNPIIVASGLGNELSERDLKYIFN